jgi:hypothetical protein
VTQVSLTGLADGVDRQATNTVISASDGQKPDRILQKNPSNVLFSSSSAPTRRPTCRASTRSSGAIATRGVTRAGRTSCHAARPSGSPANRADGFLGSDMSQDDGSY